MKARYRQNVYNACGCVVVADWAWHKPLLTRDKRHSYGGLRLAHLLYNLMKNALAYALDKRALMNGYALHFARSITDCADLLEIRFSGK